MRGTVWLALWAKGVGERERQQVTSPSRDTRPHTVGYTGGCAQAQGVKPPVRSGIRSTAFGIWGLVIGVWGFGLGIWVLGFGILSFGFGVWGLGFEIWS